MIGDAFERVLAEKNAVLNSERAQLILDMYSTMNENVRKEIEKKNKWTYRLIPFSVLQTMNTDRAGSEANLARATKDDLVRMNMQLKGMIKNELEKTKANLANQVKVEIDRIVVEQQNMRLTEMESFKNNMKRELRNIFEETFQSLS